MRGWARAGLLDPAMALACERLLVTFFARGSRQCLRHIGKVMLKSSPSDNDGVPWRHLKISCEYLDLVMPIRLQVQQSQGWPPFNDNSCLKRGVIPETACMQSIHHSMNSHGPSLRASDVKPSLHCTRISQTLTNHSLQSHRSRLLSSQHLTKALLHYTYRPLSLSHFLLATSCKEARMCAFEA